MNSSKSADRSERCSKSCLSFKQTREPHRGHESKAAAVPVLPSAYVLARQVDDDDDDAGIKSPANVGTSRQRLNRDAGSRLCARLKTLLSVPGGPGLGHWAGLGCAGLDG